jgi:small conductance mechanosensitive channel
MKSKAIKAIKSAFDE